ncbi:MAG: isoprenylcysteine carboxylmethyltransferase family protein [Flavobacteriaceae bacterium]|nr:isoprenylcysteine carboxylmethyltransferase family protein [Flavobacteriaceae bacterium]MDH3795632.1 isoprenylcysteine carboxylmethyltransferase family protein [Flavobacteriaceae bacterium]
MRLKLPPAVIFLIFVLLMYGLDRFLPFGEFDFYGRKMLIRILAWVGMLTAVWAMILFFRKKTSIDPRAPEKASSLVTSGVYKFSRNPMYLALLLFLLAWGLFLGNAFNTLLAAGFVSYMNTFQIKPEEEALLSSFGEPYARYCKEVRRWF